MDERKKKLKIPKKSKIRTRKILSHSKIVQTMDEKILGYKNRR